MRGRRPRPDRDPPRREPASSGGSECASVERRQSPISEGFGLVVALPAHFTPEFTPAGQSPDGGTALRDEDVHSLRPTSLAYAPRVLRAHTGGGGLPLPRLLPPVARPDLYCTVTPIDDRGRLADRSPIHAAGWRPGQSITITTALDRGLMTVHLGGPEAITSHGHLRLPAHVRHAFHLSPGDRLLITVTATPPRLAVYPMAALAAILNQYAPVPAAETQ